MDEDAPKEFKSGLISEREMRLHLCFEHFHLRQSFGHGRPRPLSTEKLDTSRSWSEQKRNAFGAIYVSSEYFFCRLIPKNSLSEWAGPSLVHRESHWVSPLFFCILLHLSESWRVIRTIYFLMPKGPKQKVIKLILALYNENHLRKLWSLTHNLVSPADVDVVWTRAHHASLATNPHAKKIDVFSVMKFCPVNTRVVTIK